MKPARTWILVADGSGARILEMFGRGKDVHTGSGSDAALDQSAESRTGKRQANPGIRVGRERPPCSRATALSHRLLTIFAGQLGSDARQLREKQADPSTGARGASCDAWRLWKFLEPHVREKITRAASSRT